MQEDMTTDERYMRRCIQLAECGRATAAPNPMVGAVIVCDGRIIGEGYHIRCGGPHAEVNAIASVKEADHKLLKQATIYVSLEPCAHWGKTPPCADLIISTGIPRVVVGCQDPFAKVNGLGIKKLKEAGIEVVVGVLQQECLNLNERFITFHSLHRPWVTLKWAESADGFIDRKRTAEEPASQISSDYTSTLVHRLRAEHQAIMVGTETALKDNPSLTNRLWPGESPLRVTIDRNNRLVPTLHLKDGSTPTHIYGQESLYEILDDLYRRGIQSLLVEGGKRLLESFLREGLWDEIRVETATILLHEGVAAPHVEGAEKYAEECIDGSKITWWRRAVP